MLMEDFEPKPSPKATADSTMIFLAQPKTMVPTMETFMAITSQTDPLQCQLMTWFLEMFSNLDYALYPNEPVQKNFAQHACYAFYSNANDDHSVSGS